MSKANVKVKEKKVRSTKTSEIEVNCSEVCEPDLPVKETRETYHICLMRHGKASKEYQKYDDAARPLVKRGKKDVQMMKKLLRSMHFQPDLILCSSAVRAHETLDGISGAFTEPEIIFSDELYLASTAELFHFIQQVSAEKHNVLVIGHNPGIAEFAEVICDNAISDDKVFKRMGKKFPTAAVALIELHTVWKNISDNTGRLVEFIRPKDLK